jgi:hypothetical protein
MADQNPLDRVEVPGDLTTQQRRIVARLHGYVGKVHSEWVRLSGRPWRVGPPNL